MGDMNTESVNIEITDTVDNNEQVTELKHNKQELRHTETQGDEVESTEEHNRIIASLKVDDNDNYVSSLQISQMRMETMRLNAKICRQQVEIQGLVMQMKEREAICASLEDSLKEVKDKAATEHGKLQESNEVLSEKCIENDKTIAQLQKSLSSLRTIQSTYQDTINEQNREIEMLKKELLKAQDKYNISNRELHECTERYQEELDKQSKVNDELKAANSDLSKEVTQLTENMKYYSSLNNDNIQSLVKDINFSKDNEYTRFVKEKLHLASNLKDLFQALYSAETDYNRVSCDNTLYKGKLQQMRDDNEDIRMKNKHLQDDLAQSHADLALMTSKEETARKKLAHVETDYTEMRNRFEQTTNELAHSNKELTDTKQELERLCYYRDKQADSSSFDIPQLTVSDDDPDLALPSPDLSSQGVPQLVQHIWRLTHKYRKVYTDLKQAKTDYTDLERTKNEAYQLSEEQSNKAFNVMHSLKSQIDDLQGQIHVLEKDKEALNHTLMSYKAPQQDTQDEIEQSDSNQQQERDLIAERIRQSSSYSIERYKSQFIKANKQNAEYKSDIQALKNLLNDCKTECSSLQGQLSLSNIRLEEKERLIMSLEKELQDESTRYRASNTRIEDLQKLYSEEHIKVMSLSDANKNLQRDNNKLNITLSSMEKLSNELKQSYNTLQNKAEKYAEDNAKLMKEKVAIERKSSEELNKYKTTLSGVQEELSQLQSMDVQSISKKVKVQNEEIRQLKDEIAKYEQKYTTLLKQKIHLEHELKGQTVSSSGVSSAVSLQEVTDQYDSIVSEKNQSIANLTADIEKYKQAIEELNNKLQSANDKYTTSLNEYENHLKDIQLRTGTLDALKKESQDAIDQYNELKKSYEDQIDTLSSENFELSKELSAKEKLIAEYSSSISLLNKTIDLKTVTNTKLHQDIDNMALDISKKQEAYDELRREADKLQNQLSETEKSKGLVEDTTDKLYQTYINQQEEWRSTLREMRSQQEKTHADIHALIELAQHIANSNDSHAIHEGINELIKNVKDTLEVSLSYKTKCESQFEQEHTRRHEAERALKINEMELEKLDGTTDRLRNELYNLRKQSYEAEADMKSKIDMFREQNESLNTTNFQLRRQLEELKLSLNVNAEKLGPLMTLNEDLKTKLSEAEKQISNLIESESQWSTRYEELLPKYKKAVSTDSEELKQEIDRYKIDLEKAVKEKDELEERCKDLLTKAVERGRVAKEYRRRMTETEQKLTELSTQGDNKEEVERLVKEKDAALEAQKEAQEDAKRAEASLKKRMEEYITLEQKYAVMLQKARHLQVEKNKIASLSSEKSSKVTELETKLTELETKLAELEPKLAELETKLTESKKIISENGIELSRLKAMNSMTTNKNNRMKKELDQLKANMSGKASSIDNASTSNTPPTVSGVIVPTDPTNAVENTVTESSNLVISNNENGVTDAKKNEEPKIEPVSDKKEQEADEKEEAVSDKTEEPVAHKKEPPVSEKTDEPVVNDKVEESNTPATGVKRKMRGDDEVEDDDKKPRIQG